MKCRESGCNNPLTGRQRRWCSDKCRKRQGRKTQNRTRFTKTDRPHLSGFARDVVGNSYRAALRIEIIATQTEPGMGAYSAIDHLRSIIMQERYKGALLDLMNDEVYGYSVEIKIYLQ